MPDDSISCRTIYVPTEIARVTGGDPNPYTFKLDLVGPVGASLTINGNIQIGCSETVKIIPPDIISNNPYEYS